MSPWVLAEILRVAAWQRWALHWAGWAPWQREPFVLEEWL